MNEQKNDGLVMVDENKLRNLLLHFLRSVMWGEELDTHLLSLNEKEWQWIFATASCHTVESVVFDVVSSLPESLRPCKALMMVWKKRVEEQEQEHIRQLRTVNYLYARFQSSGITPVVLKGIDLASCYPCPSHRYSGDIDLFYASVEIKNAADDVIEGWGNYLERNLNHESVFMVGNVVVENHGLLFRSQNPLVSERSKKRLQTALASPEAYCRAEILGSDILTVSPELNLFQLVQHAYMHVINSGIGLRQLVDIALFLKNRHDKIDKQKFLCWASEWKMTEWTRCLMSLLVRHLNMPVELSPVEIATSKDADRLMSEVWLTGNFGMGDSRFIVSPNSNSKKTTLRRLLHNYCLFARYSYGEAIGSFLKLVKERIKETVIKMLDNSRAV